MRKLTVFNDAAKNIQLRHRGPLPPKPILRELRTMASLLNSYNPNEDDAYYSDTGNDGQLLTIRSSCLSKLGGLRILSIAYRYEEGAAINLTSSSNYPAWNKYSCATPRTFHWNKPRTSPVIYAAERCLRFAESNTDIDGWLNAYVKLFNSMGMHRSARRLRQCFQQVAC